MMKILVIIPALNEKETLHGVILGIRSCLAQADVLVVSDGSTDSTADIARREGAIVLEHPYNMGIGVTMQTGFLYALSNGYDIAVQVDGDGQHNPEFLSAMIEPLLTGRTNLVIGSRYLLTGGFKSTFPRKIGIRFFSSLTWILTRKRITDPTSGFRAVDKKGLQLFAEEYSSDYPEVEALVAAYKKGLQFKEVPVVMRNRQGGSSSIGTLSALYYMIKVTLSILIGSLRRIR